MVDKRLSNWETFSSELHQALNFLGRFVLTTFSTNKALIEFATTMDGKALLDSQEVYLSNCTLTSRYWSPGSGSLSHEFLKVRDRWVTVKGVPLHLWCSESFDYLCSRFGKFIEMQVVESIEEKASTLRLLVKDCNPRLVPAVVPLYDYGLAYLVSILLENPVVRADSHLGFICGENGAPKTKVAVVAPDAWQVQKKTI